MSRRDRDVLTGLALLVLAVWLFAVYAPGQWRRTTRFVRAWFE